MPRTLAVLALTAVLLAGCGNAQKQTAEAEPPVEASGGSSAAAPSPGGSESTPEGASDEPGEEGDGGEGAGESLELEIEGDQVRPNGARVSVAVGQPVRIEVTSDRAAELHVHASPEQVLEVEPGSSTLTLTLERPGLVDVEEHESGFVVFRLEVR